MKKFLLIITLFTLFPSTWLPVQAQENNQTNSSNLDLTPQSYELYALDPETLSQFYQDMLGMTLVSNAENNQGIKLGTADQTVLLTIYPANQEKTQATTGLYHTAYLFKDRKALGSILKHLYESKATLQGYADHNVSEAIYLADPEGNGIELYADRPRDQWKYDDQGNVIMGNDILDLRTLIKDVPAFEGMTADTKIGHEHLTVNNIEDTQYFYSQLLGFDVTSQDEGALFMSSQGYHHHLGANIWLGQDLPSPQVGDQGLKQVNWQTKNADSFKAIQDRLTQAGWTYDLIDDQTLAVTDNSGIPITISLVSSN